MLILLYCFADSRKGSHVFEVAQYIALVAAAFLIAAVGVWAGVLRGPLLERLDGWRVANDGPTELAMVALVSAFGLSALATAFAIAGWIYG